ncbi:hypothetical protein CEXT_537151 [Caerostris extrusa]|uniref:Uncharacterized protein n=1 Tax=Caerostris extrusa TaxID=172846 RepID=A0AAV4M7B4_CAEEX|nr:hypothetical protein CEXT_537151 [Caerostris extrusa]
MSWVSHSLTPSQFILPGRDNVLPEHFLEIFNKVADKETLTRRKLYQSRLLKQRGTLSPGTLFLWKDLRSLSSSGIWEWFVGRDGHVRAWIVRTPKGQLRRAERSPSPVPELLPQDPTIALQSTTSLHQISSIAQPLQQALNCCTPSARHLNSPPATRFHLLNPSTSLYSNIHQSSAFSTPQPNCITCSTISS